MTALGIGAAVADQRQPQQTRVHDTVPRTPGDARVAAQSIGPTLGLDVLLDGGRFACPALGMRRGQLAAIGQPRGAIERDPTHHFRMRELKRTVPNFPNAGVGLTPDVADAIGNPSEHDAGVVVERVMPFAVEPGGFEEGAVTTELAA